MVLVILADYRTPEQRAAKPADPEPGEPAPVIVVVGDAEANQAKQWLAALGDRANVEKVDLIA